MHAPPGSKPLRFRHSGRPQRRRLSWTCILCPSQVQTAQVFGERSHCALSPLPSLPFGFLGVQPSQADVDCPEPQEVLAKKPACSLVDNASLGLRLPLPALAACHPRWVVCSRLVLFSPLFCERAWRCLRAFRVVAIPQSGLLAQVSSL